jgi:hypothetical protein
MTDKEKITEILKAYTKKHNISASVVILEEYAEELVKQGVIVPPCKVGDTVYVIMETSCEDVDLANTVCEFYKKLHEDMCTLPRGKCPYKYIIRACEVNKSNILHFSEKFGKTVFLTKEEAEAELEKRGVSNAENN